MSKSFRKITAFMLCMQLVFFGTAMPLSFSAEEELIKGYDSNGTAVRDPFEEPVETDVPEAVSKHSEFLDDSPLSAPTGEEEEEEEEEEAEIEEVKTAIKETVREIVHTMYEISFRYEQMNYVSEGTKLQEEPKPLQANLLLASLVNTVDKENSNKEVRNLLSRLFASMSSGKTTAQGTVLNNVDISQEGDRDGKISAAKTLTVPGSISYETDKEIKHMQHLPSGLNDTNGIDEYGFFETLDKELDKMSFDDIKAIYTEVKRTYEQFREIMNMQDASHRGLHAASRIPKDLHQEDASGEAGHGVDLTGMEGIISSVELSKRDAAILRMFNSGSNEYMHSWQYALAWLMAGAKDRLRAIEKYRELMNFRREVYEMKKQKRKVRIVHDGKSVNYLPIFRLLKEGGKLQLIALKAGLDVRGQITQDAATA